jgi:hypothetical protein
MPRKRSRKFGAVLLHLFFLRPRANHYGAGGKRLRARGVLEMKMRGCEVEIRIRFAELPRRAKKCSVPYPLRALHRVFRQYRIRRSRHLGVEISPSP